MYILGSSRMRSLKARGEKKSSYVKMGHTRLQVLTQVLKKMTYGVLLQAKDKSVPN